jgi:hypothetical protein
LHPPGAFEAVDAKRYDRSLRGGLRASAAELWEIIVHLSAEVLQVPSDARGALRKLVEVPWEISLIVSPYFSILIFMVSLLHGVTAWLTARDDSFAVSPRPAVSLVLTPPLLQRFLS